MKKHAFPGAVLAVLAALSSSMNLAAQKVIHVNLAYRAPADGQPKPNFSPKGTQVPLVDIASSAILPAGAIRPAKTGLIRVGPDTASWIPVLAAASMEHPADLMQLYLDRNRNGDFGDDGAALTATPTQNAKTKAWWSSISKVELTVPYTKSKTVEPYFVNFWLVRDDSAAAPAILRYSVGSWRYGTAKVNGIDVLVAAMDADNDAVFAKGDNWSIVAAGEPKAAQAVLTTVEARATSRFMFVPTPAKDIVLEFRSFSPDGRSIDFAVIKKPVTKAADRAPDDLLINERPRPRAQVPFPWAHAGTEFTKAVARAKETGRYVFIDFETTWCGPCHSMDEWIWTDAEVAGQLNAGFIGVKLDGDIEKALVKRFNVSGYPTMIILDSAGTEVKRATGYLSSKEILEMIAVKKQ